MSEFRKQIEKNPLERLEQAIKNRPIPDAPDEFSIEGLDYPESLEKWVEGFEKKFAEFKKQCVCIPRKQLEEKLGNCVGERAKGCRRLDHALIRELLEELK